MPSTLSSIVSSFIAKVISLFKKETTHIPKGSCYAVLRGDYFGEIFCFFHQRNDVLYFVSLPKMELREVKKMKFNIGIEEKILDSIQKIPKNIFKVVESHGNSLLPNK
jgi:hypothetical protein